MTRGPRAGVAALIFATLVLVTTAAGTSPATATDPHVVPIDPASIDNPDALVELYRVPLGTRSTDPTEDARCGAAAPDPVPDGVPIAVTIPPAPSFTVGAIPTTWWRSPPVADPSWRLNFQGLMWMKPLARRAAQDGQQQFPGRARLEPRPSVLPVRPRRPAVARTSLTRTAAGHRLLGRRGVRQRPVSTDREGVLGCPAPAPGAECALAAPRLPQGRRQPVVMMMPTGLCR